MRDLHATIYDEPLDVAELQSFGSEIQSIMQMFSDYIDNFDIVNNELSLYVESGIRIVEEYLQNI